MLPHVVPSSPWLGLIGPLLWTLLGSAPLPAAQPAPAQDAAPGSLLQVLREDGRFTRWLALCERRGLDRRLERAVDLTVVVPTDAAFAALPAETVAALDDPARADELDQLLGFHLIEERWTLERLGTRGRVPSVQGQELGLRQLGPQRYALDVGVLLEVDRPAANGVWHVVDALLQPPGLTLLDEALRFGRGRHVYAVDRDHSAVLFRILHMEVGAQWGWFRDFQGELVVDSERPEESSILLVVDASSIDTRNEARDAYLRTRDFFHTEEHPAMTFRSTAVEPLGGGDLRVTGELSLRGVTREVTCDVVALGQGRFGPLSYKVGYETRFSIRRSDFGMGFGIPGVAGDEVTLTIALEGTRDL